jgi:hypothetical protein
MPKTSAGISQGDGFNLSRILGTQSRLSLASFLASSIKLSGSRQLSVFLTVCDMSMKLKIKNTFT